MAVRDDLSRRPCLPPPCGEYLPSRPQVLEERTGYTLVYDVDPLPCGLGEVLDAMRCGQQALVHLLTDHAAGTPTPTLQPGECLDRPRQHRNLAVGPIG